MKSADEDCKVQNCATCNADKTHCDQCAQGFEANSDRTQCTASCKVQNCATCNADKTHCDQCAQGFEANSDRTQCEPSSANRSALPTGAIAGISVAAVVVVGGLVGFLCWWFICRGKA